MSAAWFAGRLKDLREQAGLTQSQLADKAGMHKLTVAKLEQSLREPSWATVIALAAALDVPCTAFLQRPAQRPRQRPGRPVKSRPRLGPRKGAG
jgi:transcriptional regulator with XRE-family HTH domain